MSFAGLQQRLQKKAAPTKTTPPDTTTPVHEADYKPTVSSSSIYAIAAKEACANHAERKRPRSPCEDVQPPCSIPTRDGGTPATPSLENPPVEKTKPKILSETDFLARRQFAEEVVSRCAKQMSQIASSTPTSSCTSSGNKELRAHRITALPLPLCRYLEQRLQRPSAATCVSTAANEEEEHDLFCALHAVVDSQRIEVEAVPSELEALVTILRTFWHGLCWHWRMALCGLEDSATRYGGWTYDAYLLSRHALPDLVRCARGREVALTLETWREAYRVRQCVLDFLAYALHDVNTVMEFSSNGDRKCDAAPRIIPTEIVDSLYDMVQHLRRRDFATCRQLYVDLTMGTANWKLGLFSGGEVHMRRSLERIERRRIAHLLHNEGAVRLLHALRELMDFVQLHEAALLSSGLFVTESKMS
ncbi:hypothetical protein DQ04_01821080 [Trypanosoma grayi]|uniref:hypothetical protein n=1 Tax=Trypanosoma grayi TaxID=71804 RepID=UPI0004F4418A|nr:hypothetical protein DQ04_01821080 [Trypanosoma grayi]KEG12303.1 hypothetical protein DQ04_01821080 [Trypanosoma grayi]